MTSSRLRTLYRVAAVLLALFAISHQFGFQRVDPNWHANTVTTAMQTTHFNVGSFSRSYWMFFSGFGYFVTVLLLFSAVVCWALSNAVMHLHDLMLIPWSLAACYSAIAILSWRYFFVAPGVLATGLALLLLIAASGVRKVR